MGHEDRRSYSGRLEERAPEAARGKTPEAAASDAARRDEAKLATLSAPAAWSLARERGFLIRRVAVPSGDLFSFVIMSPGQRASRHKPIRYITISELPSITVYQQLVRFTEERATELFALLAKLERSVISDIRALRQAMRPEPLDENAVVDAWFRRSRPPPAAIDSLIALDQRLTRLKILQSKIESLRHDLQKTTEQIEVDLLSAAVEQKAALSETEERAARRGIKNEYKQLERQAADLQAGLEAPDDAKVNINPFR